MTIFEGLTNKKLGKLMTQLLQDIDALLRGRK